MDYPLRPVFENWRLVGQGLLVTLEVALLTLVLSLAAGGALAFLRVTPSGPGQLVARAYVRLFRNVPPLILLFFVYFALPKSGIVLSAFWSGVLGLSLYHAAFAAEIFRAGIEAVGRAQFEAASAIGLNRAQAMRYVVLPQALAMVVPALGNLTVSLTKTTSLVATISVADIMYQAQYLEAATFRTFEVFAFAGAVYLVLVLVLEHFTDDFERRLTRYRVRTA
jgi:His/Glu/Gln/Arg/opine family amino acid ABC transporter permease subunit